MGRGITGKMEVYFGDEQMDVSYVPYSDVETEVGILTLHSLDSDKRWENLSIDMYFKTVEDIDRFINQLENFRSDIIAAKQDTNLNIFDYLDNEILI